MKKLLLIIACFMALAVNAEDKTYPKITIDGKEFYLYTVQKSEGFFSISQRFGVPQVMIIEANPNTENGLQLGQIIKIPVLENAIIKDDDIENVKPDFPVKTYTVRPKDTLYSLSKKYKLTVDDILKVNPHATNLNIGDILYIPDSTTIKKQLKKEKTELIKKNKYNSLTKKAFKVEDIATKESEENDTLETTLDSDMFFSDEEIISKNYNGNFKVAILLPFMLEATKRDASMDRFVEFYKGCVIAADSLSKFGINIEISAFDIGKTQSKITSVLSNPSLKEVDLIIGPAYQSQIPYVSKFAQENRIRTVIPFSSNVPDIKSNKFLYGVVSPQKDLYSTLSDAFCTLFKNHLVVILQTESITTYNKSDFTDLLLPQLKKSDIDYTYINDYKIANQIDSISSLTEKDVILLTPSTNEVLLNKLGEQIELINSKKVSVFAFPEWNGYLIDELYSLPVYSFTSYSTDYDNDRTKRFFKLFTDKFGIPSIQQTPNYAIFGFDIFYFFINNMNKYGKRFDNHLEWIKNQGLQMNFSFQKVSIGGHCNMGIIIQKVDSNGLKSLN